jgi:histone H3/H4
MTTNEIIDKNEVLKMARQAGFMLVTDSQEGQSDWYECFTEEIEAFAKLVAEAAASKAVEREREACALLAATPVGTIAREIRARGEPTSRGTEA